MSLLGAVDIRAVSCCELVVWANKDVDLLINYLHLNVFTEIHSLKKIMFLTFLKSS